MKKLVGKRFCSVSRLAIALIGWTFCIQPSPAGVVSFDWATISNAANPPDPLNAMAIPGIGSVDYSFRMATTEVTNNNYAEFLNAIDAAGTNPHGVYNTNMGSFVSGGISFLSGAASGTKYRVKTNMGDKPVNFVSYLDAMRFVNWMENGQGSGGTESGVYTISNGVNEIRAPNAQYFIPTENEWYKAAYYHPAAQGGDSDGYWRYPTRSNVKPSKALANLVGDILNPGSNVANYGLGAAWNGQSGNVTTVGSAGSPSSSYYGTHDQGGNLYEWNQTRIGNSRVIRGGSWIDDETGLESSNRPISAPMSETLDYGFRIASAIPEPSCSAFLAICALFVLRRQR